MTNSDIYLSLLRAGLWGAPVEQIEAPVDWQGVVELCRIHATGPIVFDQALRLTGEQAPDPALALQMKQQCLASMIAQQQWDSFIRKTWQALQTNPDASKKEEKAPKSPEGGETKEPITIHPVLLKGFGLASLYPQPHLRQWGDLDVWVGVDCYHEACYRLRRAFPGVLHPLEEYENYKHYNFEFEDGHIIELHRVAMEFVRSSDWRYWQQIEPAGMQGGPTLRIGDTEVSLPQDDFNLLFTFVHALEHFCGTGIPFRQLCDLALLAHAVYGTADAEHRQATDTYLNRHLQALHMLEPWQLIGYVICRALALPKEEWPLYSDTKQTAQQGEKLFARILHEGQCRPVKRSDKKTFRSVMHRKIYTLTSMWDSHRAISSSFPSYARHLFVGHIKKGVRRTIRREAPYSHAKSREL